MSETVGIVLVSHSPQLALGLRELLKQLGSGAVTVAVAAGTDDGRIGTSYALVLNAIAEADQGAGVVILPDLGSSVLTARTVLDDHPDTAAVLVDSPFVEGAVAAAITSSIGADLASVSAAAREARDVRKL